MSTCFLSFSLINNGNRTEWSPIRSVIMRVNMKLGEIGRVQFVNHEYDYRPASDDMKSHYQLTISITISNCKCPINALIGGGYWPIRFEEIAILMITLIQGHLPMQWPQKAFFTWWSIRGSHTTRRRGSRKAAWIWLVNVPGVKRPATATAPVWAANFRMARWKWCP